MLFKNIRIIIVIILLLIFTYFLISPFVFRKSGVIVNFVDEDNQCSQIKEGDAVNQIGGFVISNSEDFERALQNIKAEEHVTMVINNGPGSCEALRDRYIGIDVVEIPSKQLKFGLDIQGGEVSIFKPKETVSPSELENGKVIIEKRIKSLGLPETRVYTSDSTIKIASLMERIGTLIKLGNFEAKIGQEVDFENGTGEIRLGDNFYDIEIEGEKLKINDSYYQTDQSFLLEDIEFKILNITNSSLSIETEFFDNDDVTKVSSSLSFVRYNPDFRAHEFNVPLEISNEASNKFMKISKGLKVSFDVRQSLLECYLVYYLDGEEISKLNKPFGMEMAGTEIGSIYVVGFGGENEVQNQKSKIQAILESGTLFELEIIGKENFEPTLRNTALELTSLTALFIIASTTVLIYRRYKNKKVFLAPLLIGIEVFCVVGIAALTQFNFSPGWILDLFSVLGLIGFSFVSFSLFIIKTEEKVKQRQLFLRRKHRRIVSLSVFSYFLVFLIAFVLLFTPIKGVGFSIIIGLFIGVITKPIYVGLFR